MVDHLLQRRIAAVRKEAKRVVWQTAVLRFFIVILGSALVAGVIDYGFRVDDPGLQVLLSLLVVLIGIVAATISFGPALRYRLSDVKLARHLESRHPELKGSLSSGVAFLACDIEDRRFGSAELRREVIRRAALETESIDFSSVVNHGMPRRMRRVLFGLVGIGLVLFCLSPSHWTLAARRLVSPLGSPDWPRRHRLEFERVPSTIAIGADLEVAVIDRNGRLPASVQLVTMPVDTTGDDSRLQTVQQLTPRDGRMVGTIEKVTRSLKFRAIGGDDDRMPWQEVDVVEPPRTRNLRIVLHPPEYSFWPAETVDKGIRALVGTRVAVEGRSDSAIASATLHVYTEDGEQTIPATVEADGRTFRISVDQPPEWVIRASGYFSIVLRNRQQIEAPVGETGEIRALVDNPPAIVWQQPSDGALITRHAKVPVRLIASDDLAVRRVVIEYRRSDRSDEGWTACRVFNVPRRPPGDRSLREEEGESHALHWQWDVSLLDPLAPDVVLEMRAIAEDYLPQSRVSEIRQLQVVTQSQMRRWIHGRQAELLSGLRDLLAEQRAIESRTARMTILSQPSSSSPISVANIQSLESAQRRIRKRLATDDESLLVKLRQLSTEIRSNELDENAANQVHRLSEVLVRVNETSLPAAEEQLFAALQRAADPESPREGLIESLQAAQRHQEGVVQSLESTVSDLAGWDKRQSIVRDLEGIIAQQEQLRMETQRVWRTTVTRTVRTDEERSEVDRLGRKQRELTRHWERVSVRMATMGQEMESTDATTAKAMAHVLDVGQEYRVASHMQRGVERMQQWQLAEAATQQQLAVDGLQAMRQMLRSKRQPIVAVPEQTRKISELQRRVQDQAAEQQVLIDETTQREDSKRKGQLQSEVAVAPAGDLAARQRALRVNVDRLDRGLLRSTLYSLAFRRVIREMDRAAENLLRHQTGETTRRYQQRARRGLLAIVESLGSVERQEGQEPNRSPGTGLDNSRKMKPGDLPESLDLATLRLMRHIQADIRQRTAELTAAGKNARLLTDAERQEWDELSRDQGDLVEWVIQMTGAPRAITVHGSTENKPLMNTNEH